MKFSEALGLPVGKKVKLLKKWNDAYRNGDAIVSDKAFDTLFDTLPPEHKDKFGVGVEIGKTSRKEPLPFPMYSMDKVKTIEEVKSWITNKNISLDEDIVITPKFDGLSFLKEHGKDRAWTRGNGEVGQQSISHFNKMMESKSSQYEHKDLEGQYLIGEVIMSKQNFENKYKNKPVMKGNKAPKNPRNFVAGFFNSDEPSEFLRDVTYMAFGVSNETENKSAILDKLNLVNHHQVPYKIIKGKDLNHEMLNDFFNDWNVDFEIDGLIL
jgi:DNA ligase (NAD+)